MFNDYSRYAEFRYSEIRIEYGIDLSNDPTRRSIGYAYLTGRRGANRISEHRLTGVSTKNTISPENRQPKKPNGGFCSKFEDLNS